MSLLDTLASLAGRHEVTAFAPRGDGMRLRQFTLGTTRIQVLDDFDDARCAEVASALAAAPSVVANLVRKAEERVDEDLLPAEMADGVEVTYRVEGQRLEFVDGPLIGRCDASTAIRFLSECCLWDAEDAYALYAACLDGGDPGEIRRRASLLCMEATR